MTPDEKRSYARTFPVHVGVDTSKTFHVCVARGPDGNRTKAFRVAVTREGFEAGEAHLRELFPTIPHDKILFGLEFAGHHGFTYARFLADQGHPVVNILPVHTKRTKEIEDNSPLKSDAKDAALICKLVGDGTFVRFPFLKRPFVELRLLTVHRYRLVVEMTRYRNRLQGLLDLAWPEFLGHFSGLHKVTPRAILNRWALPRDFLSAPLRDVRRLIKAASRGHIVGARVEALFASARNTIGLAEAPDERRLEMSYLLRRWALAEEQCTDIEGRIEAVVRECPAAEALLSVPEVSAVTAATLVSELGTPEDFESPRQVIKLAGMNLVGTSSGLRDERRTPKWQSKRGRPMLRRQLFLLAGRWCQKPTKKRLGLYRGDYLAILARNGGLRTKAICSIARKLVPLLLQVMQTKQPFDLVSWRANRNERGAA